MGHVMRHRNPRVSKGIRYAPLSVEYTFSRDMQKTPERNPFLRVDKSLQGFPTARRAKRQKLTLLFKKTEFGAPPFDSSVRFGSNRIKEFLPEATKRGIPHMSVCSVSVTHDPTQSLSEADFTPLPVDVPARALGAS